jgi:hypothetical protein
MYFNFAFTVSGGDFILTSKPTGIDHLGAKKWPPRGNKTLGLDFLLRPKLARSTLLKHSKAVKGSGGAALTPLASSM